MRGTGGEAAGAPRVAIDTVEERLASRSPSGPGGHLTEDDPRAAVSRTEGRGVDGAIDAVGHPDALDSRAAHAQGGTVSAIGVYAERIEVHMGIVWIKALTLKTGHANVIGHVDRVL